MTDVEAITQEIENMDVNKGEEKVEMTAAAKKRAKKKASQKLKNAEAAKANEAIRAATPEGESSGEVEKKKLTPAEVKKLAMSRGKKKKKGTNSAVAAMAAEKAKAPKPLRHNDYEATWDTMDGDFGGGLVHDD